MLYAEPVCNADDGPQIAGVLHTVKSKAELASGHLDKFRPPVFALGHFKHAQHLTRCLEQRQTLQFRLAHLHQLRTAHSLLKHALGLEMAESVGRDVERLARKEREEVCRGLGAFGHEGARRGAEFLERKGMDMLDGVLADHVGRGKMNGSVTTDGMKEEERGKRFLTPAVIRRVFNCRIGPEEACEGPVLSATVKNFTQSYKVISN